MAFPHRDENSATGRANFSAAAQRALNRGAIAAQLDNMRGQQDWTVGRRRAQQFDGILSRHSAWRMISARLFHQMIRRGPVAVTIKQRPDYPTIQHAGKCFVLRLWFPFRDDFIVLCETSNSQTVGIRWPATPARICRAVLFLKRLLHDDAGLY